MVYCSFLYDKQHRRVLSFMVRHFLSIFRCSSHCSMSEEHLLGLCMYVCHVFPMMIGNLHDQDSLLHKIGHLLLLLFLFSLFCCYSMPLPSLDLTPICLYHVKLDFSGLKKTRPAPGTLPPVGLGHFWGLCSKWASSGNFPPPPAPSLKQDLFNL
jgi:hypothetical protein